MKIKLYFYHEQWTHEHESKIAAWPFKCDEELTGPRLRIFLCEHDVEMPDVSLLSEAEVKHMMVTGLRQEAKNLQADTHMKLSAIEEKIQQLLCIDNRSDKERIND